MPVPWDWLFWWWIVLFFGSEAVCSIAPSSAFGSFGGRFYEEWYIMWSFEFGLRVFYWEFAILACPPLLRCFWLPPVSLFCSKLGKDCCDVIGVFVFMVIWDGTVWSDWCGCWTCWWGCLAFAFDDFASPFELAFLVEWGPEPWALSNCRLWLFADFLLSTYGPLFGVTVFCICL